MDLFVLIGRICFSLIFITAAPAHFQHSTIAYAASQGVPFAELAVPASGLLATFSGLAIATGYKVRWGAWGVILFLVPVTLSMHNFWALADPAARALQKIMFMKNLSMFGGALLLTHFGSGPFGIDTRR